jgi:hypothetical protein
MQTESESKIRALMATLAFFPYMKIVVDELK